MNTNKNALVKKKTNVVLVYGIVTLYAAFVLCSFLLKLEAGISIGKNTSIFAVDMLKLFPPAFILVGLFMVWFERRTIEKYFGEASGIFGFIVAILLACTTLYPFVVVLPMALVLSKKGARVSIVLTYLGATAVCRIPMTIFETSFIGIKFSIIRYAVSLPLIVFSSLLMEKMLGKDYFEKNNLTTNYE